MDWLDQNNVPYDAPRFCYCRAWKYRMVNHNVLLKVDENVFKDEYKEYNKPQMKIDPIDDDF